MDKISLQINIAGRTYPLNILKSEKEKVEFAAKQINEAVEYLQTNYKVKDAQDLLAMASLQLLSKRKNTMTTDSNELKVDDKELEGELQKISSEIKSLL